MTVIEITHLRRQVIALKPVNAKGIGEATEIYTRSGETLLDPHGIKSVLRAYIRPWCLDITALRRNYGPICGATLAVPIPLEHGHVLVPIKMRAAMIKDDAAYGFVDLDSVTGLESLPRRSQSDDARTIIHLGQVELATSATLKHVQNRLAKGRVVASAADSDRHQPEPRLDQQRYELLRLLEAVLRSGGQ